MDKKIKWRVNFLESERGWGQDTWHNDYDTKEAALKAEADCNAKNTSPTAPDYYIQAEYKGPVEV
jgi:hypothetical protein